MKAHYVKTIKLEVVTPEAYLDHLKAKVEANHKTYKSGTRRGGNLTVARLYGVTGQFISGIINGGDKPSHKMLDMDGLEELKGHFVKKAKGGR